MSNCCVFLASGYNVAVRTLLDIKERPLVTWQPCGTSLTYMAWLFGKFCTSLLSNKHHMHVLSLPLCVQAVFHGYAILMFTVVLALGCPALGGSRHDR